MSFALEHRKKYLIGRDAPPLAPARKSRRERTKSRDANAALVAGSMSERRVLLTLLLAGLILSVFNSGALVRYTRGLSESVMGTRIIDVSEKWHGLMETGRMTALSEGIRSSVSLARNSSWDDIAEQLGFGARRALRDTDRPNRSSNGIVTSIPGPYGDQPAKPVRSLSADQSG